MGEPEEDVANSVEGILHEEGIAVLSGLKDVDLDPHELDQLFNCDNPLLLSKEQRAVIVEGLRRSRVKYLSAKKTKASAKAKREKATPAEIEGMNLDDLNLDLSDLVKE